MDDYELRALVAEKVMGWSRYTPVGEITRWFDMRGGEPEYVGDESVPNMPPPFPSSMDAAMRVVEKMRSTHVFYVDEHTSPPRQYRVTFVTFDDNAHFVAKNATLPRAICIAALRAKGVEV